MVGFFFRQQKQSRAEIAFSTYVGTAILVSNCFARFVHGGSVVIEWTRPLSEVVCVAGLLMATMLYIHENGEFPVLHALNFAGHVAVGASVYGAAVTWQAVAAASVVLEIALLVYWYLGVWPYPLSPIETFVLCLCILTIRLI